MHDAQLVIKTDHKPLKGLFESPIQNKKIQYWTTNFRGYNCEVEYIEGKKNVCADMLSRLPHKEQDSCSESEVSGADITDKTFEINMINSSNLRTKDFEQFSGPLGDDQPSREELTVPHYDMVIEQAKDKVLLNLKEEIQSVKASSSVLIISTSFLMIFCITYQHPTQIPSLDCISQAYNRASNYGIP